MRVLRAASAALLPLAAALLLLAAAALPAAAQCPMCAASAAGQDARAMQSLNFGILILLVPPVAIMAGILVAAFRRD